MSVSQAKYPDLVYEYIKAKDGKRGFDPVSLLGAVYMPDSLATQDWDHLDAIVRYRTSIYNERANEFVILSLLLGDNVQANSIFGWADITKYHMDLQASSGCIVSEPLGLEFDIECMEPMVTRPAPSESQKSFLSAAASTPSAVHHQQDLDASSGPLPSRSQESLSSSATATAPLQQDGATALQGDDEQQAKYTRMDLAAEARERVSSTSNTVKKSSSPGADDDVQTAAETGTTSTSQPGVVPSGSPHNDNASSPIQAKVLTYSLDATQPSSDLKAAPAPVPPSDQQAPKPLDHPDAPDIPTADCAPSTIADVPAPNSTPKPEGPEPAPTYWTSKDDSISAPLVAPSDIAAHNASMAAYDAAFGSDPLPCKQGEATSTPVFTNIVEEHGPAYSTRRVALKSPPAEH